MEAKAKNVQLGILVLIFVATGIVIHVREENAYRNCGIMNETLSHQQWRIEYQSQWQDVIQSFKDLLEKFFSSASASLGNIFPNHLYTTAGYEIKRNNISRFISCQKTTDSERESNSNGQIRCITNCITDITKPDIFSTVLKRTESNLPTNRHPVTFKRDNGNFSQFQSRNNKVTATLNPPVTKSRSFKYATSDQSRILSTIYDNQKEFDAYLEDEWPGDVNITNDSVASPSLDFGGSTLLAVPLEAQGEGNFITNHTPVSSTMELTGSMRSLADSPGYNQGTSGMTSTPVMSDSSEYSVSSAQESATSDPLEMRGGYSSVHYSGYSSSAVAYLPEMLYSESINMSSSILNDSVPSSDSFLNSSDEYP